MCSPLTQFREKHWSSFNKYIYDATQLTKHNNIKNHQQNYGQPFSCHLVSLPLVAIDMKGRNTAVSCCILCLEMWLKKCYRCSPFKRTSHYKLTTFENKSLPMNSDGENEKKIRQLISAFKQIVSCCTLAYGSWSFSAFVCYFSKV